MSRFNDTRFAGSRLFAILAVASAFGSISLQAAQATAALHIVVIEGEDAVNVVQQKTAVAPVVEVRDRNDQPVAGAVVRFVIRNGHATFGGGAQMLAVPTNAAGRAIAAGLTPTGNGMRRIGASAAFQGQTAAITIAQTNVMTLAQAAAVTSAGASGGGAGAGASAGGAAGGGTGGGLSATTIGIVGGAAAGGTVLATNVLGGSTTYEGSFTIRTTDALVNTLNGAPNGSCFMPDTLSGTLTVDLDVQSDGSATGKIDAQWSETVGPNSFCPGCQIAHDGNGGAINGTTSDLRWSGENRFSGQNDSGKNDGVRAYSFTGALSGNTITGTWRRRSRAFSSRRLRRAPLRLKGIRRPAPQ